MQTIWGTSSTTRAVLRPVSPTASPDTVTSSTSSTISTLRTITLHGGQS